MIIAIDGYEANSDHLVGVGRYAYELIKGLYKIASRRAQISSSPLTFRIYLPEAPRHGFPPQTSWWSYRIGKPKKLWTFGGLPLALSLDLPLADCVFSPTHYIPRFVRIPRVCAIMDVSYLHFPELFNPKDLYQLTSWTRYSVYHAQAIVTISEYSKHAIMKAYGIDPGRIVVTYPGIPTPRMSDKKQFHELSSRYRVAKHYILSVGTIQPRKNFERLIEAFSIFKKKNKQPFGEIQLVIAGKKGWLYDSILEAPARFGVDSSVLFLDYVTDEDLPVLYKNALCFALPSLYEGFGLPVAEAMSYGCPVVVSRVSSLPEIAGKAGVYVDPMNAESIADGLLHAVRERNLKQGKLRIVRGYTQIKKFSWETAAKETIEILTRAASKTV